MGDYPQDDPHIDLPLDQICDRDTTVVAFRAGGVIVEGFVYREGENLVAYVNRCAHVPYPLDFADGKFLSKDKKTFECQSHGARYHLWTGLCVRGPCKGRQLVSIPVSVLDNTTVRLYTAVVDKGRKPPHDDESLTLSPLEGNDRH